MEELRAWIEVLNEAWYGNRPELNAKLRKLGREDLIKAGRHATIIEASKKITELAEAM